MLQLCNQRTPRVLHKGRDLFFCHHRRALSLLRPYEREREREREKERKRRARKNDADENFVSTKYAKRGKKTSRCDCFSAATREREREIGSETRCIITQFSVILRRLLILHFC